MSSQRLIVAQLLALTTSISAIAGCFGSHGPEGAMPVGSDPPSRTAVDDCTACTLDEVCVQPCGGVGVVCVPRPEKICDAPACECYASDPCDMLRSVSAACVSVDPAPASLERPATIQCACAGPPPTCEDRLRSRVTSGCSFSETCEDPIDGIPCCTRTGRCEDGVFVEESFCDDDCAQTCDLIEDPRDCEGFGCVWDGAACASF